MMLDKAIKLAQGSESEKVAMSLRLSPELKNSLQEIAEREKVSLNSLICSILEVSLADTHIADLEKVEKLQELQQTEKELITLRDEGEELLEFNDGTKLEVLKELDMTQYLIAVLKGEK